MTSRYEIKKYKNKRNKNIKKQKESHLKKCVNKSSIRYSFSDSLLEE